MNLPPGAQTWGSCGFDTAWTNEAHLLAGAIDLLNAGNWQRGGGSKKPPDPLPRPGDLVAAQMRTDRLARKARNFKNRQKQRADN
ncbi:MAG: hypothetical protein ABW143_08995 [Acidimicrobiales bacterium]